jgi:exonuclease VII small subunit
MNLKAETDHRPAPPAFEAQAHAVLRELEDSCRELEQQEENLSQSLRKVQDAIHRNKARQGALRAYLEPPERDDTIPY